MARQISSENSYRDILVKLIPSEIVGTFIAVQGILSGPNEKEYLPLLWIIFMILLLSIPFYLKFFYRVLNTRQIACTMLSFVVWTYSVGGPCKGTAIYDPKIGGALLALWIFLIPFVMRRTTLICKGDFVNVIDRKPNSGIERDAYLIDWNDEMSEYVSKEAQVVAISKRKRTARLDIDNKKNEWPFEWLKLQTKK